MKNTTSYTWHLFSLAACFFYRCYCEERIIPLRLAATNLPIGKLRLVTCLVTSGSALNAYNYSLLNNFTITTVSTCVLWARNLDMPHTQMSVSQALDIHGDIVLLKKNLVIRVSNKNGAVPDLHR